MSSGADARRELVKALRKAAKDCGLASEQLPKDTASRQKVQELAGKAAASNGGGFYLTSESCGVVGQPLQEKTAVAFVDESEGTS